MLSLLLFLLAFSCLPQALAMDGTEAPAPQRVHILPQATELRVVEPEHTLLAHGRDSLLSIPSLTIKGKVRPITVCTTVNDVQPGGQPSVPHTKFMEKDPELGAI